MVLRIKFGPAGTPIDYKGPVEGIPSFLRSIGLDAFEYEAVRGVRISEDKARRLGFEATSNNVVVSLHAPYYVNLASPDDVTFSKSIERIVEAMKAAEWMGAYAVVVHSGYYKGYKTREEALRRVIEGYRRVLEELPPWVKKPSIAPETMGKTSQVGGVEEVVEICRNVERCRPCIDWAHLHARSEGKLSVTMDDVIRIVELLEKELGKQAVNPLHTHFSKIKYGKGGEREHKVLESKGFGPEWDPICKAYIELGIDAVVISESPILDKDAILMKRICESQQS